MMVHRGAFVNIIINLWVAVLVAEAQAGTLLNTSAVVSEVQLVQPVSSIDLNHTSYTFISYFSVNTTEKNEKSSNSSLKVSLPPLDCTLSNDCWAYTDQPLECQGGQCTCREPYCWVYHYEGVDAFVAKFVFTCGQCGVLGSACNKTSDDCDFPGQCWSDSFCHCPHGENHEGVCLTTDTLWAYKVAIGGLVIMFAFGVFVVALGCIKSPPWRHPHTWRSCCRNSTQSNARQGRAQTKSPAFTVQAHYTSQVTQDWSIATDNRRGSNTTNTPPPPPHLYLGDTLPAHPSTGVAAASTTQVTNNNDSSIPDSIAQVADGGNSVGQGPCSVAGSNHQRCALCLPRPSTSP